MYGTGELYAFLDGKGITSYIPLKRESIGTGKYGTHGLKYDLERDVYVCGQGHDLTPFSKLLKGNKFYRMLGQHCRNCPSAEGCVPEGYREVGRRCLRNIFQDNIEKVQQRSSSDAFSQRMIERKWKIEGLFAEAKSNHQMRRARFRTIARVHQQILLIATVQNLKRMIKLNAASCFEKFAACS